MGRNGAIGGWFGLSIPKPRVLCKEKRHLCVAATWYILRLLHFCGDRRLSPSGAALMGCTFAFVQLFALSFSTNLAQISRAFPLVLLTTSPGLPDQ
jgi:hypothetical protein